jgi:hypothetical protein
MSRRGSSARCRAGTPSAPLEVGRKRHRSSCSHTDLTSFAEVSPWHTP